MKLFLTLIVVAGLAAGGYFLWKHSPATEPNGRLAGRPTTAIVEARDIRFTVNAAGDIGPADQVSVRPEINGRIDELPVDIGDKVKKGDLLCRLDDKDLQIERSTRLTEIDGAKLQLQKASRTYGRNRDLFQQKLISLEVFEDTRTDFDLSTNALERTEKALRQVEDRLSKTKIMAPFDCTVLTRPVSLGQTVSGSAGFNSGTEIMTIANLSDMIINAHINQADVSRLTPGQEVEIQVESVPGLRMKGALERVAPQAIVKNGIKGFAARVIIKQIDPRVLPGMTAIVAVPVASAENVLAVPLAAVFTEKGERFVYVKKEGDEKVERRPVLIGVTDYSFAEVQKGLSAGEVVALEPPADAHGGKGPPGGGASGNRSARGAGAGASGGSSGGRPAGDGPRSARPSGS